MCPPCPWFALLKLTRFSHRKMALEGTLSRGPYLKVSFPALLGPDQCLKGVAGGMPVEL